MLGALLASTDHEDPNTTVDSKDSGKVKTFLESMLATEVPESIIRVPTCETFEEDLKA